MNAKEFQDKFNLSNFDELEAAFKEAKDFFDNFGNKTVTFQEIKSRFPVIVEGNLILILYPTFKIWIIDKEIAHHDVVELVKEIENIAVDVETEVLNLDTGRRIYPTTIHCYSKELEINRTICSNIMQLLDKENIICERCVEMTCHKVFVNTDEKGNIIGVK